MNDTPAAAEPPGRDPQDDAAHDFGEPSNYSLPAWHLAPHVRWLESQGWQPWEVQTRFEFWQAA